MAIKVFQKGETTFSSGNGYKTPTNPLIESDTTFGLEDRLFTLVYPNDSTSSETFVEVGTSTENTERDNLQTTKGFRIKCYDSITTTGVQLSGANYDSDYHYFVLVHSDDHLKHHFARVTDIITEDVAGDAFEFTPALGKEIPKDTKFMLFKGPIKTTTAIAFSAGIKKDLQDALVVSSPLFHLLESSLNKKNELDHNTKYFVRLNKTDSGGTTTLDSSSEQYTFVTEQEFSNKILDYSKYSMQLTLVDKLKDLDNPSTHTSNEGNTIDSLDYTDYDDAFPNARRDSDDLINPTSVIVNEGPIRYLHYDYSPTKVNALNNVIDNKLEQSIGNRGGFCETKILNPSRILTSKIKEFDKYRVRHRVFTGDLNEFVDMKITLGSHISSRQYNIITDYSDARNFINVGDEVKIGTRILLCSAITTSTITFEEYSRLETESSFTNSTSLTSLTGTLQRRAYNYQDNTILTSFNLLAGRTSELYVKTMSKDMEFIESSVTAVDATHGLITLSSNSQSYSSDSSLRYSLGSYHIEVERFSGTIEKVDSYKEDSQNYVELSGRSDISKLFGPIINKDTAFSEDIIYSSSSPYNKLGNIKSGNTYTVALGDTEIDTGIVAGVSFFDNYPVTGTRLFGVNGYVGEVIGLSFHASVNRKLIITPAITELNSEALYMDIEKNYVFNKALSSSHLASVNPTSLTGSAGKGVFFTSGKKINAITKSGTTVSSSATVTVADTSDLIVGMAVKGHLSIPTGSTIVSIDNSTTITISANATSAFTQDILFFGGEGDNLVGSSINTNPKAIGYHINNPVSINNDNAFQAKFADEIGSESNSSFDTVNALIDFEVVSIEKKGNESTITLAPYLPITLGRKMPNYGNGSSYTLTGEATIQNTDFGGYTFNSLFRNVIETTNDGIKDFDYGDAVFAGANSNSAEFVGFVNAFHFKTTTAYGPLLILDRNYVAITGHKLYSVVKDTHDLFFVNGQHLWGGKILTIPHPKITSSGAVPINFENIYSTADIAKKYGQMYYKLLSVSDGNFNLLNSKTTFFLDSQNTNYENISKLKHHAISYKFSPNISASNINNYDKTGTGNDIHMDLDMRGIDSVYGSNFAEPKVRLQKTLAQNKYPNIFSSSTMNKIEELKRDVDQKDTSAATLLFYINSDILPYSSLRKDSIMHSDKTIKKYNLFLMQNKKAVNEELEYTDTSAGKIKNITDNTFQSISFNSDKDISSLKRFGIMRLTELCFDAHFNAFNPEKPTTSDKNHLRGSFFYTYRFADTTNTIHVANSLSANSDEIVLDTVGATPTAGQLYFDSNFSFIGEVQSYDASTKTITLSGDSVRNDENTFTAGSLFRQNERITVSMKGAKDSDTFISLDRAHLQKGALVTQNYANHGNDFWAQNTDNNGQYLTFDSDDRIILPIRFQHVNTASLTSSPSPQVPSRVFNSMLEADVASSSITGKSVFGQCKAVVLDTYTIEQGGLVDVEKGLAIPSTGIRREDFNNVATPPNNKNTILFAINNNQRTFGLEYPQDFGVSATTGLQAIGSGGNTMEAMGAKLGFCPRLHYVAADHDTATTVNSSNGTLHSVGLNAVTTSHGWLDFVDLTGCYLVSESGFDNDLKSTATTGGSDATDMRRLDNVIPEDIIYIVSHTINNSGSVKHNLITDKALTNNRAYRIMKPNETAFYENSPKKISLNTLSPKYTKKANSDEMYSPSQDYAIKEGSREKSDTGLGPIQEAILSMYVAVDLDKQSSSEDYIVMRKAKNFTDILPEGNHVLYMSDGENNQSTSIVVSENTDFTTEKQIMLEFGNMKEMHGIVSVSETFTVTSNETIEIEPTRACIGTTATIANETEELINELMEENDIVFDLETQDYPLYLAPNYQGVDLFSAINFLLEQKDLTLFEENGTFKIKDKLANDFFKGIVLNETGEYQIFDFEESKNMFNFYNQITVYGRNHKKVRKDIRSINNVGLKSFEVFNAELTTQEDVNKEASALLRLHSSSNKKLKVTVGHSKISQIKVGDIINVEIPRENIPLSEYMVLQIEYLLTGLMVLELGKYSKGLEDRFAELIIQNKKINSQLRNESFKESESLDFLEELKINQIRLFARKRTSTGTFKLGFGTTLNTGTTTLGYGVGTGITFTTLIDEELI